MYREIPADSSENVDEDISRLVDPSSERSVPFFPSLRVSRSSLQPWSKCLLCSVGNRKLRKGRISHCLASFEHSPGDPLLQGMYLVIYALLSGRLDVLNALRFPPLNNRIHGRREASPTYVSIYRSQIPSEQRRVPEKPFSPQGTHPTITRSARR